MRKLLNKELQRKNIEEFKNADKISIMVILDNLRSMNNIGSIFRTCDAFLIDTVFLCGITATPPHNEIRKTALGAEDSVHWVYIDNTPEAVNQLKNEGWYIVAIEQTENAKLLNEFIFDPRKKYALVFGNEVKGIEQTIVDLCDSAVEIPQEGTKHSLNVSVSVGIVLWEFYKKINET
jgi:23S rRNA (guanosine2251-2'-O)-methyltransferase